MSRKYLISVIMPLYNIEDFFEEAIESIIGQTIDFQENIQVILVNDGSPDNIEALCLKYKEKYPDNILYVKQENQGVSCARNTGMNYIKGKYVNFFDADDRWDKDAYRLAYNYLEEKCNEIDIVSCRYCFFDKRQGFIHPLDNKFSKKRVIDIFKEPQEVQMAVNALLIKAEALKNTAFDARLKLAEDTIFATKLICQKGKYGVIPEAIYNYRKRMNNDSAIDMTTTNPSWYFDTPQFCYKEMFRYSIEKYGRVIPYIQHAAMYDIQWRLKPRIPADFSRQERQTYIRRLTDLMQDIDDTVIASQKNISFIYKLYALKLKYSRDIAGELQVGDGAAWFHDARIFNLRQKHKFQINNLDIKGEELWLEGSTDLGILSENYQILCKRADGSAAPLTLRPMPHRDVTGFTGERIFEGKGFALKIPLKKGDAIQFVLAGRDGETVKLKPALNEFAKLEPGLPLYYCSGSYMIKLSKSRLLVLENSWKRRLLAAGRLAKVLIKKKKYGILRARVKYHICKRFCRKPVWICSDRTDMARDNGEHLFRYLSQSRAAADCSLYFALDEASPDFDRMRQYGKVLKLGSAEYKMKFLLADKIISSHADPWVYNAFGGQKKYFKDLCEFDFVFLQHGIIKDDFSSWLHKQKKNIGLFLTSSQRERESILNGDYGYAREEVALTGLPRFDALKTGSKKQVLIFPTWRKQLAAPLLKGSSERAYLEDFRESEYFRFYNRLINDPVLHRKLEDAGYSAVFYVHPAFKKQAKDFDQNDRIRVITQVPDYTELFCGSAMLVTDYSSVYFDFAYMKKPVIYAMFDREAFYQTHTCKRGYFDYEEDGFGPVCRDYESTLETIAAAISRGCVMEEVYARRAEDFFRWIDQNNCKRVYEAIKE